VASRWLGTAVDADLVARARMVRRARDAVLDGRTPPGIVRDVVLDSWHRSMRAAVDPARPAPRLVGEGDAAARLASHRLGEIAPLDEEEGEPVVRSGQLGVELEGPSIRPDRLVHAPGAREGDRHVLEDAGIVRVIPHRQAVRRQRRVEVALTLQRQRLIEIIEALRLWAVVRLAADQAAEP